MPKKQLTGTIISDKMQKTVVVKVERVKEHAKYKRRFKVHKNYKAHVESEEYKTGDRVVIEECLPLSKDKTWKVIKKGMIQPRTMLKVVDNTGAKMIQCFHVLGGTKKRFAKIGDVIVATVKEAEPRRIVKKHDVVRALIVRQKNNFRRADGTYIRFDENAVVILEGKTNDPKGGRITGPLPREIKEKGFEKIANLATELI